MASSLPERAALLVIGLCWACDTAGIKRSYMALDAEGHRRRDTFFTDTESIFCVAELASGVDDLTVRGTFNQHAVFSSDDGHAIAVQAFIGSAELAPGAGEDLITAFELQRENQEDPYTAGEYVCSLFLDGELESELSFEIRYPACPVAPVEPGFRCAGFVLDGASCAGATGGTCVCGPTGIWSCS